MIDTLVFDDSDSTIHNGDCREVLASFANDTVDFVLTDPPYAVEYQGRWNSEGKTIVGDSSTEWILPAFREIWRVLKQDSFCLSFYGWPHAELFLSAWKFIGFRPISHVVCVKNNIGLGYFSRSQHEPAYLLAKGKPPRPQPALSDVYSWERESNILHPSQKPLGAISRLLKATAERVIWFLIHLWEAARRW
jgi:adenine-specific DNA-methyltransferase